MRTASQPIPPRRPVPCRAAAILAAVVAAAILTGCAIGPNYRRPTIDAPAAFRGGPPSAPEASLADVSWWNLFRDETLQHLIDTALADNYDLKIAVTRVEQASALAMQTRAELVPQIGYAGEAARGRNTFLQTPLPSNGRTGNAFLGILNASWEVDLWGRIRRLDEAARAEMLADVDAQRGVTLSLVCAVARSYFELLELEAELAIATRTVASFEHSLKLFTDRLRNGIASKLETSRADAALSAVAATVPELERQIALRENVLSVLIGRNPAPVPHTASLLDEAVPPDVPAGLPSALLERRPDVHAAENRLRAANARVGVSIGEFFPKVGLTALYGGVSAELSALTSGGANAWSIAANVSGPLFQGGRLYGQYREARAARDEAELRYRQTALTAFREVSDALISRQKLDQARTQQARAVAANRDAVDLSTQRYLTGLASYFEVLEAQQQLFPAENGLARIELDRRLVVIDLYQALGGGWDIGTTAGPLGPSPSE